MMRHVATLGLCLSMVGVPMMIGCDRTVAEKTTEKTNSDGTTTVDKTKTTQAPDGSTQTQTEHSTDGNK